MKIYKVTKLAYAQDLSKSVFKSIDRYWRTSGQPVIYASSSQIMASQEYFHSVSDVNDPDELVTCRYEVPPNIPITYLSKAVLRGSADNDSLFFMIRAVAKNWRENGDTLILKIPMTFLPGKDLLVNPMHINFQQLKLEATIPFDISKQQNAKVPELTMPGKNARRRHKSEKPNLDVMFCHPPKQKQQIVNALRKEINRYGLRYLVDTELVLYNDSIRKGLMKRLDQSKYVIIVVTEELLDKSIAGTELERVLQQQLLTGEKRVVLVIQASEPMIGTLLHKLPLLKTYRYYKWKNNANEIIKDIMARMAIYP